MMVSVSNYGCSPVATIKIRVKTLYQIVEFPDVKKLHTLIVLLVVIIRILDELLRYVFEIYYMRDGIFFSMPSFSLFALLACLLNSMDSINVKQGQTTHAQ